MLHHIRKLIKFGFSKQKHTKPLDRAGWAEHYNLGSLDLLVRNIREQVFSYQTKEMLRITQRGDSVLEIGSGTGETSLCLALHGRNCTSLDFSAPCLELTRQAAKVLNCQVETVLADASMPLPFENKMFDVVFQAGLLEHFERADRIHLLRNWSIAGSKKMVSIIPNAGSLAYRVGKALMEKDGSWSYGMELPQYTLYQEFLEAGFCVTHEYTIGESHSMNFLPSSHYLRTALERWLQENPCEDNCGQGYLLVTIGEKNGSCSTI